MVLVVGDPSEGGEHREQRAAHLDEGPHQPEVPGGHPLVEKHDTEPHAVGGEAGVPRHEAQPHVVQPRASQRGSLGAAELRLAETREVCDVARRVRGPAHSLSHQDIGVANLNKVRPQST